jgi:CRISPR-associated protein Cas1
MIKRTIYFGNPVYLSLRDAQMQVRLPEVVKNEFFQTEFRANSEVSIPVEDLGLIVLDHRQITITQALLEALLHNNTLVLTCDNTHHPTGMLLPLSGNTIQQERFLEQIKASEPLKKQLWAQTITQKIKNQYAVLKRRRLEADYLLPLYRNVKSGDADNCEATAAAYYWKTCFKEIESFKRFR